MSVDPTRERITDPVGYIHEKYGFYIPWKLNPLQERVFSETNMHNGEHLVIASPTSSGKTLIALVAMARALSRGETVIYCSPLKSLSLEKYNDFKRLFPGKNVMIMTGDYELTPARKEEFQRSDITVMTYEMLNSRMTHHRSETSQALRRVGCLVVDETHLIGDGSRGPTVECLLIQFTQLLDAQIVALSATMGDHMQIATWFETLEAAADRTKDGDRCSLCGYRDSGDCPGYGSESSRYGCADFKAPPRRKVWAFRSDWRPTVIHHQYVTFYGEPWDAKPKLAGILSIMKEYHKPGWKWLVFTPSKAESVKVAKELRDNGYRAAHHNSDLDLEERVEIPNEFVNGNLDAIACTPTLALGMDKLQAKAIITSGTYRGINPISPIEIIQARGRCGRTGTGDGHAFTLVSDNTRWEEERRLEHVEVLSALSNPLLLLFHLNNQIYFGCDTWPAIRDWFDLTFAKHVMHWSNNVVKAALDKLETIGAIEVVRGETALTRGGYDDETHFVLKTPGKVAAQLYFNPLDICSWADRFAQVFKEDKHTVDAWISWAMTTPTQVAAEEYVSRKEEAAVTEYNAYLLQNGVCTSLVEAKHAMRWNQCIVLGNPPPAANALRWDLERKFSAIAMLNGFLHWDRYSELKSIKFRVRYAAPIEHAALLEIRGVGQAYAKKLFDKDIRSPQDVIDRSEEVVSLLGPATGSTIVKNAQRALAPKRDAWKRAEDESWSSLTCTAKPWSSI